MLLAITHQEQREGTIRGWPEAEGGDGVDGHGQYLGCEGGGEELVRVERGVLNQVEDCQGQRDGELDASA